MFDHGRIRREAIRWYLIVAANVTRPAGSYVPAMLSIVQTVYADATDVELRRELAYLEERGLVSITKDAMGRWFVALTHHGIDLAEYTTICQPGISRPQISAGG